jgi:hypothetical protein
VQRIKWLDQAFSSSPPDEGENIGLNGEPALTLGPQAYRRTESRSNMNDGDKVQAADARVEKSDGWVTPAIVRLRAGSAEVGTRTEVQDGPLAESRS